VEALEPSPFQISFKTLQLEKINLDYRNEVSSFYTMLDLGSLQVTSNAIDLNKQVINLDDVALKNTVASIRLGKTGSAKVVEKEVEQEVETQAEAGWRIFANNLDLENNELRFDNDNSPRVNKGMDYAHLMARDFTLNAKNVLLDTDSIAGTISNASFKEQSGFVLNQLKTEFLYTPREAYLRNLYLETPGTKLQREA